MYYQGKSRYMGVFDSKLDAAVGYELAREVLNEFKDDAVTDEQAKENILLMRKAAFSFMEHKGSVAPIKRQKTVDTKPKGPRKPPRDRSTDAVTTMVTRQKPAAATAVTAAPTMTTRRSGRVHTEPDPISDRSSERSSDEEIEVVQSTPKAAKPVQQQPTAAAATAPTDMNVDSPPSPSQKIVTKDLPEVGPGWTVQIRTRKDGLSRDCEYLPSPLTAFCCEQPRLKQ